MEGTAGESNRLDLYSIFPLPVLPSKSLFPGDTWQAQHLFGTIDLENLATTDKLTVGLKARGTFIGVEWEKGIPCAKFSVQVDAGPRDIVNAVNLNNQPGEATQVKLDGMIWFALDRGVIVKSEMMMVQESLVTIGTPQGQGLGGGIAGGASGRPGEGGTIGMPPGGKAGEGGGPGGPGAIGFTKGQFTLDPHIDGHGQLVFFRQSGGPPLPPKGGGLAGGGQTGPGFGNRTGGGSGGTQKVILRVRLRLLTELEQ
jgi:hypothetical protein